MEEAAPPPAEGGAFNFLLVLATAMFIGSFGAGSVPLLVNLSESRMRMVTIFGAGLLVGTALAVIIPEGVESLYSAQTHPVHGAVSHELHSHPQQQAEALDILEKNAEKKPDAPRIIPQGAVLNDGVNESVNKREKRDVDAAAERDKERLIKKRDAAAVEESSHGHSHSHAHESLGKTAHGAMGFSLVIGFVFMLIVDQISSATTNRNGRTRLSVTATVGLVVHAAADGVALGSASTLSKSDVQIIVFVAIMLHKAPAAFGLVSFLLMEGLDRARARRHLLVFSLAAPVAAILTYGCLASFGASSPRESSTGILMLFSAGTFLYVATVHVLPELGKVSRTSSSASSESLLEGGHSHSAGVVFSLRELAAMCAGALIPAFIASGHSH